MCVLVASSVCKNEMGDITETERHKRGKASNRGTEWQKLREEGGVLGGQGER